MFRIPGFQIAHNIVDLEPLAPAVPPVEESVVSETRSCALETDVTARDIRESLVLTLDRAPSNTGPKAGGPTETGGRQSSMSWIHPARNPLSPYRDAWGSV